MSGKRIETLIWGSVISNGKKYYLLEPTPEKSRKVWMLEGTLCWQVADVDSWYLGEEGKQTYLASKLIFGKDATVELFDNPEVTKVVEYYFSDDESEEVLGSPV